MLGRVRLFYRREIEGRVGAAICENPYYDAGLIGRSRADPDWKNRTGFRISSPEKPLYGTQNRPQFPWNRDLFGAAREFGFRDESMPFWLANSQLPCIFPPNREIGFRRRVRS